MQTFLPLPSFDGSVKCLDWRRLGKQRVEAMQILNVLTGKTEKLGWRNHPAVRMWKGYEDALFLYMDACIVEWIDRGYNNTMKLSGVHGSCILPPWFGDDMFHASHRSNLLRKDPKHYAAFGWIEGNDMPYVWPC